MGDEAKTVINHLLHDQMTGHFHTELGSFEDFWGISYRLTFLLYYLYHLFMQRSLEIALVCSAAYMSTKQLATE